MNSCASFSSIEGMRGSDGALALTSAAADTRSGAGPSVGPTVLEEEELLPTLGPEGSTTASFAKMSRGGFPKRRASK